MPNANQQTLTHVPADLVAEIVREFDQDGAIVVSQQREQDGTYSVTGVFAEEGAKETKPAAAHHKRGDAGA